MSNNPQASIDDAIAAARAGRREDAARLLRQIVANDPFNADAWVWLGGVTSDAREQRSALEQALTVAPNNQRAQQGLNWLRQHRPDVFDATSATRPRSDRSTPSYEQPAAGTARAYEAEPFRATPYDAPTQAMPATNAANAPTQAAPVVLPPVDRTTLQSSERTPPITKPAQVYEPARTDQMRVPPPAVTGSQTEPVYERRRGANTARWLLIILWLLGFGATATIAALTILNPAQFGPVSNQVLATLLGWQLDPTGTGLIGIITALVLIGIAVFDFIMILGLGLRGRWAWVINLLIALVTFAGAVAIVVFTFAPAPSSAGLGGFPAPQLVGPLALTNPVVLIRLGLLLFNTLYLFLSFGSRRAFFRRRVDQSYGR